jgi:hypothetical protein
VVLAKRFKDFSGIREISDEFVIGLRNVLKDEGLQRLIICLPNAVAFWVSSDVRLRERSIEPISQSILISDQCHMEAPFLLVGLRAIKA